MTTWQPHKDCPAHLVEQIKAYGNSLPTSWRTEPFAGDVFDSPDHAFGRLQGYAFLNGFAVVKWRSTKADSSDPRARYRCIHHGDESKNWRELEQHIERDDAGNILSQRKREDTFLYKFACKWMVYVTLKPIHYGATTKVWTIGISSLDHSHALVANPLSYAVHLKVLPEHQLALAAAVSHRFAVISWSASNRILDHLG